MTSVDPAAVDPTAPDPLAVLDTRPGAAEPRPYHFPRFERQALANGLEVVHADVPGRPLLLAQLMVRGTDGGGATLEPDGQAGVTVLMARALTEGTVWRDAVELIDAAERLGAELSADAGWDSLTASVEVPRSRLRPALALLAEMALEPSLPEAEVKRLRDERINDLLQAKAEPRRRVERVFPETIYGAAAPYRRPLAGTEATVPGLDRDAVVARHRTLLQPAASSLIIAGDLEGIDVAEEAQRAFGAWPAREEVVEGSGASVANEPDPAGPRVVLVDRPGSAQSEIRVGHVGAARSTPDFHALSVLNAILGGLFGSRLNRLLREARGYTYGVHSAFDLRLGPGPFAVRCAVQTEVTAPAITDIVAELRRIREDPPTQEELTTARDYLVGVFPLRFETAAQVAVAITGLRALGLPDDELDRYRPAIAAVTAEGAIAAAHEHIHPDRASIVVVGDAARVEAPLREAGLGEVTVVRDEPDAP
jgi:zinc protease